MVVISATMNPLIGKEKDIPRFNQQKVDSLSQLNKYNYVLSAKPPVSLWQRIKWYIKKWRQKVFGHPEAVKFWYAMAIIVIVLVIFRLLRANFSDGLLKKNQNIQNNSVPLPRNIFRINFDLAINQAHEQKNYQEAIRLCFLKSLKLLHENEQIKWSKTKTNADYTYEIKHSGLLNQFIGITYWFDYVVYGNFMLNEPLYKKAISDFDQFANQINHIKSHE